MTSSTLFISSFFQAVSSYMHILPDEEYSEKPIYSTGGSMNGGIEPAGYKHGYILRSFGK